MSATADWRPIIAALGNRDARLVFARLVVGDPDPFAGLSPSRSRHVRETLQVAGLLADADGDGAVLDEAVFARVLATTPRPVRGIERYLRSDGRIDRYPSAAADRRALLVHIVERAIPADAVLSERELGERLESFADDVAVLRRHLVDHGLLERTRSGSEYARAALRESPAE